MKLYGFIVYYEPYDDRIWWFNGDSGEYICRAPYPSAINKNGMYVSQPEKDCDFVLDLQYFRYNGNNIFEYGTYQNTDLNIESTFYDDNSQYSPIFWSADNTLFLKAYDAKLHEYIFLKIKIP